MQYRKDFEKPTFFAIVVSEFMQAIFRHIISETHPLRMLLLTFGALSIGSILLGLATEFYLLLALPMVFLLVYLTIVDFRTVFFLLMACLPLSTELHFDSGLSTDFPTEPLILGLMGVYTLYAIRHYERIDGRFFRHPISILIGLHLGWIAVTTVTSSYPLISIKFTLAKVWYIVTFYLLAGHLLKEKKDIRQFFVWIMIPLCFTIITVLIRHAAYGFSFEDVYRVLNPFYRNHVNYACIIALFFPFAWYAVYWYWDRPKVRYLLIFAIPFLLIATYLSYTRAAYVALLMAAGTYFIIRFRLMKFVLAGAVIAAIWGMAHLAHHNNYLDYAPQFEKAISHANFDDLLAATYQFEDVSTMERVYRWVAGTFMAIDSPWVGFGPGNFYHFYHSYTVNSFRTYVSDNPEQSSAHNYYLTVALEQGVIGLLIFVFICFYALLNAEQIYHRLRSTEERTYLMAVTLAFFVILATLLINDLIETDKIGSFFFLLLAMLVNCDLRSQRLEKTKEV